MAAGLSLETSGSFIRTEAFLSKMSKGAIYGKLDRYAKEGVQALSDATPVDSHKTASSWGYIIKRSRRSVTISWTNKSVVDGTPIVIMLHYGHATGTGGYVQGKDFINPALKPVFDKIATNVWKAVTTA